MEPRPARRAGAPALRASAEFPGLADVNSFLPRGKEVARQARAGTGLPPPLLRIPLLGMGSWGGWQAARGETGIVDLGPLRCSPLQLLAPERAGSPRAAWAAAPARAPPVRGWRSQSGSYRRRRGWAAAPWSTWGSGGGCGRRGLAQAGGGYVGPRARRGPAVLGSRAQPGMSQKSPCLITYS